jgi:MoxR-like ATPase
VEVEDIRAVATPVLRHRLVLNYNAESQGQTAETVIQRLVSETPLHPGAKKASERVERLLKA